VSSVIEPLDVSALLAGVAAEGRAVDVSVTVGATVLVALRRAAFRGIPRPSASATCLTAHFESYISFARSQTGV